MAKSKYSHVDEYGFERAEDFNYDAYDQFMSNYMGILTKRALRWNQLLKPDLELYPKNNTIKRFVRKGVPSDRRVAVWMSVSGAQELRNRSLHTYNKMKTTVDGGNKGIDDIIKIDLPRTFPDNIYFINQENLQTQLFNVLRVFAHQNTDVGYCQGLNYIVGLLLLATKNEEVSYWLLKCLVENILPQYYISNMAGLLMDLDVLDEFVQKLEPQIHRHIKNIGMPWAMGTTKWFVCLFCEVLPTETVFRIWDCLFYEGSKIIFRVALTLIRMHKNEILQTSDISELIACFRNMRNHERVVDCHLFMKDVFRIPGRFSNRTLEKLRKKHTKPK